MKLLISSSILLVLICLFSFDKKDPGENTWIRINYLGYKPGGTKVAVWCSKEDKGLKSFQLIDAMNNKIVFTGNAGKAFGAYGPFVETYRLNFSSFKKTGKILFENW